MLWYSNGTDNDDDDDGVLLKKSWFVTQVYQVWRDWQVEQVRLDHGTMNRISQKHILRVKDLLVSVTIYIYLTDRRSYDWLKL